MVMVRWVVGVSALVVPGIDPISERVFFESPICHAVPSETVLVLCGTMMKGESGIIGPIDFWKERSYEVKPVRCEKNL